MTEAWAGYSTLDRLWRVRVHMRAWSHPECDDLEPVAREQFTGRSPRNSRRPSIASRLQPHCGDPHSGHEHLLGRGSLGPQRHARDGTVVRVRIEFQRLGIRLGLWKRFIEQQRLVVRLGPVQRIVDVVLRQRIGQREWVEFQRRRNGDVLDRAEGKPPILSDMDRPSVSCWTSRSVSRSSGSLTSWRSCAERFPSTSNRVASGSRFFETINGPAGTSSALSTRMSPPLNSTSAGSPRTIT